MKSNKTESVVLSSTVLLIWLLFILIVAIILRFNLKEDDPIESNEEPTETQAVYVDPNSSEVVTTASDLYSVYWEEKDLARAIIDDNPYISEFEALDLVNLTKEITESTTEINYRYILAIISVESNFNSDAISPSGAVGYMQLIPKWFVQRGFDHGFPYISTPKENITLGVEYLEEMYRETDDLRLATMAYNMGLQEAKAAYNGTANWYVQLVESSYSNLVERVS